MTTARWSGWLFIAGFVLSFVEPVRPLSAQVLEADVLQRKQEDQQRARTLTRDLVGGVLDIQLRQLEENGLHDQEIYRDIKLMRQHLNHLVETEMSQVVELLAETQRLPKEKREASFVEARQQIRAIVRQLAIERRTLLRRLKIAELAEQAQRLIRQQTQIQTATRRLPQEQQARQETLTLKAIEDQRDVKELYLQLVETMLDLKSWDGVIATTAADGLRILKAADVAKHLDDASRHLQSVKYDPASESQDQVLKGLLKLLSIIERTQGALNSERLAAADRIRALGEKQRQLREETTKLPENQPPPAGLVERQSQLQSEIARLQELVHSSPRAEAMVEQAEKAAFDAAANLLDNKREDAQVQQGRVLANLTALELTLKEPDSERARDKSADELAQIVQALNQIQSRLMDAKQQQDQSEATARNDAQAAVQAAKEVAALLKMPDDASPLSASVEASLAEAAETAVNSVKLLAGAPPEKASADVEKALQQSNQAIERAMNTVSAAIAETQRLESAIKIGELARAAEVLERAAAEERAVAKEAGLIAQDSGSDPAEIQKQAGEMAERQQNLQAIAQKTSQAISRTAPEAAKAANEGAAMAGQSAENLQNLANGNGKDTPAVARQAADAASIAADKLSTSARQIRDEIISTAKALADRSAVQANKLTESRKSVETSADRLPSGGPLTQLQAAKNKLNEAMQEQAKAQGKPDAAATIRLINQIASALDSQDAATAAAVAAEAGIGSELKATALQEEVAEKSQAAAESASKRSPAAAGGNTSPSEPINQALNEAHQAAAQAARQSLDGNKPAAQSSRKAAEDALKKAMTLAQAEVAAAEKSSPHGPLDHQAQANAAARVSEAQKLAADVSAKAGNDLAVAVAAAETAQQALAAKSVQAPASQAKSADAMREADKSLDAAIMTATAELARALKERSLSDRSLADRIAAVDPSSADAVSRASEAAKMGTKVSDAPQQMTTAARIAESALENAVANLGAKEQEIHRDQAIAESLANLAREQQMAADRIKEHAANLEERAAKQKAGEAADPAVQTAAQKLTEAQQQFADSQRATGQGAVEISGQAQVANPPLREALELASNLPINDVPMSFLNDVMAPERQAVPARELAIESDEPPAGEIASDAASPASGENAVAGQGKRSPAKAAPANPSSLGTGFIPQTPELTAEMMAGPKAQKEVQKALGQLPLPKGDQANQTPSTRRANQSDLEDEFGSEQGNSSKLGQKSGASTNQKVRDGANEKQPEGASSFKSETGQSRESDEALQARQFKEEAWFAKLPPELRKSIRTGAGQKPPRAYEERLKKYFQSVD